MRFPHLYNIWINSVSYVYGAAKVLKAFQVTFTLLLVQLLISPFASISLSFRRFRGI
ncbi:hypothetical protein Pint_07414 [Pistacia integerrima]|uniref:Uncharacterized protein n=1 Tax=Pistacia integerrima TaxID=434235 RepID=A0ACC0XT50_9ROSI|nr:hypothetical protein Pint_07414 [Pistacia integerrima]